MKGRAHKVHQFLSNGFCKNIGCLVSALTFSIGGFEAMLEVGFTKDKWKEKLYILNEGGVQFV